MTESIQSLTTEPDFAKGGGTITAIAQDYLSGAILMVALMDREAYELTVKTGEMHYKSRTRGLWHKGATSGNIQKVVSLHLDCDQDALVALVNPMGPSCHTGAASCFSMPGADPITRLSQTITQRGMESETVSETSYTARLLRDENLRLKKLGEETAELVTALAKHDRQRAIEEGADILYHTLVALSAEGISLDDIKLELLKRVR